MKKYKVAIIGPTFSGNKGSATMLISCIERLEKIILIQQFSLFSYYPKEDKRINPYKKVSIYSSSPINLVMKLFPLALLYKTLLSLRLPTYYLENISEIKALRDADIVVDIAGVSFVDNREKFLPFNILTIWIALLLNKPVVKYSQALGPFKHKLNKMAATLFLPRMKLIFARGKTTENYLKSLGLNNVVLAADGGFCLQSRAQDQKFTKKIKNTTFFSKKIVGISPSSVILKNCQKIGLKYEEILAKFCKYLISSNYSVLLIPYSVRKNFSSDFNNDLPVCLRISNLVGDQKYCMVIEEDLPPQKLNMAIKLTDFFVASRFHSMVASLSMGIPTLVCGWSHKYREVLEFFELENYAFNYRELKGSVLEKKFQYLEKNQQEIKRQIRKSLPMIKKSSEKQTLIIKNLLKASV